MACSPWHTVWGAQPERVAARNKRRGCCHVLWNELSTALGAAACQYGATIFRSHACAEPVCARTPHFARLVGALHSMGSVDGSVGIKKGGKAKPLSAKVSIDDSHGNPSACAALGIDCAALFSGPVEAAAEAARGSVSLDSMHLRFGG